MTSVLFHWLSVFPLFFCYISAIPPGWSGGYLTPLQCILLSYMHTALLSPPPPKKNIYLQSLHLIYPTPYTYTDCVSFIPQHILTQLASHLSFDIYPHSLHLICPPTITTQPTSHLFPHIYTYTACISLDIYPHNLHLINSPTNNYKAVHLIYSPTYIPAQPTYPSTGPHNLHLINPPTNNYTAVHLIYFPTYIPTHPASHFSIPYI